MEKAFVTVVAPNTYPSAPDIAAMVLGDKVLISRLPSDRTMFDWKQAGEFSLLELTALRQVMFMLPYCDDAFVKVLGEVKAAIDGYALQAYAEYEERQQES